MNPSLELSVAEAQETESIRRWVFCFSRNDSVWSTDIINRNCDLSGKPTILARSLPLENSTLYSLSLLIFMYLWGFARGLPLPKLWLDHSHLFLSVLSMSYFLIPWAQCATFTNRVSFKHAHPNLLAAPNFSSPAGYYCLAALCRKISEMVR
jgi:hypothetical protein